MTDTRTIETDSAIDRIFGPVAQAQTWINILYLLISFPVGVAYFVVLVTLLSTGFSLLPVFVGLFVLWAALLTCDVLGDVDRAILNTMLAAAIPPRPAAPLPPAGVFQRMLATAKRPGTLKRLAYLSLRMPMGILSLILVTVLLPLSVGLLTLPFTYSIVPVTVGTMPVETFDEAIYLCCAGAVFTLLSVHVLNSWAGVCRRFGRTMLS